MWFFQCQDRTWGAVHIVQFHNRNYQLLENWLLQKCNGKSIQFDTDFIAFENSNDAMLFKLIWG